MYVGIVGIVGSTMMDEWMMLTVRLMLSREQYQHSSEAIRVRKGESLDTEH